MLKEYDVIRLKRTNAGDPLPVGTGGTVLIVHDADPAACEFEFMDGAESLGEMPMRLSAKPAKAG